MCIFVPTTVAERIEVRFKSQPFAMGGLFFLAIIFVSFDLTFTSVKMPSKDIYDITPKGTESSDWCRVILHLYIDIYNKSNWKIAK